MRKLLAAGAVSLGVLGSCLSAAQASDRAAFAPDVAVQAAGAAQDAVAVVPEPEDLDESSQELDDALSLPVPDAALDEEPPARASLAAEAEDYVAEEDIQAPDPVVNTSAAEVACKARVVAAEAAGDEASVTCASWEPQASVAELSAAVDAWPTPAWCDDNGANGKWYVNRFKACGIFPGSLQEVHPRTGRVTGTMQFLVRAYAYSKRDIKTWAYQVELMEVSSTGTLKGVDAAGQAKCAGKCKVAESTFPSQPMSKSKDAVGQFFMDTTIKTSPKGQKGEGQVTAAWRFSKAGNTSNELSLMTPPVRCDNALPGTSKTGCTMPYIPEMAYAKNGEYPELAQHIEYAQTTKNLPGKHGTKRYLTRLTDKTKMRQNRNKACPSSLERPVGKQCDEYPFASTWQGAEHGGGDFSRRMIDATQNEEGGKALSRFYLYNRIIEKDKFLVWIK
ncbi:NucA/NucB deoxyribonuclease domain-containing protein [Streptomyces daghestanicus]|uniref:Deoxyribonuclease NucA/NucB domain-containing protein n=1 Tax=Streptomyces daghestanicus TaxID=66885 RepID=A0ABQ3Q7Y8_9ACTN|nr:NucA/NucB deoxyribonuclease domain-containing protein [Streptomyces daghestanicus]GGU67828.1 hypothetical protein GCM10010259_67470 [Streptomyces daghestanicus]GHI33403.1 hypothetical protein Sdagh_51330 [Streptomyces daghestanicus]